MWAEFGRVCVSTSEKSVANLGKPQRSSGQPRSMFVEFGLHLGSRNDLSGPPTSITAAGPTFVQIRALRARSTQGSWAVCGLVFRFLFEASDRVAPPSTQQARA